MDGRLDPMIRFVQGNLLDAQVQALVNAVNTVGVMGKGIALMFKTAFPANIRAYENACKRGDVVVGRMFVTEISSRKICRWIINFPTKKHWRNPSELEWITDGLEDLKRIIRAYNLRSIALPALGTGNGGLDWSEVRVEIERVLGDLERVDILVYEPVGNAQTVR